MSGTVLFRFFCCVCVFCATILVPHSFAFFVFFCVFVFLVFRACLTSGAVSCKLAKHTEAEVHLINSFFSFSIPFVFSVT